MDKKIGLVDIPQPNLKNSRDTTMITSHILSDATAIVHSVDSAESNWKSGLSESDVKTILGQYQFAKEILNNLQPRFQDSLGVDISQKEMAPSN